MLNTLVSRRQPLQRSQHSRPTPRTPPSRRLTVVDATPPGDRISKGLNVMEWTGGLVPQGLLVTGVQESWKLAWSTLVRELAPQDKDGGYYRQKSAFTGRIGSPQFPASPRRTLPTATV